MGLAQNFKAYVADTFPECLVPDDAPAPVGAVLDVMVLLHSFEPQPGEERPAARLAASVWEAICDCPDAALAFDVSATTPRAKEMEWDRRPPPAVTVTPAEIEEALLFDGLPDYRALISSRDARSVLCRWIVHQMVLRMRLSNRVRRLLVLGDGVPVLAERIGDQVTETLRPDLARSLHGEADVSGIFAAHAIRAGGPVECRTSDTDWVLVAALNHFPGMRVRMHHFDRASRALKVMRVDPGRLRDASCTRYGVTPPQWAALVLSRGTDFVDRLVGGLPDWDRYLRECSAAMGRVKRGPAVTEEAVDTEALHSVFVAASANASRAKLRYERNDGALARLAWHLLYIIHCPLKGGEGLDCMRFGWALDDAGRVSHRRLKHATLTRGAAS